MKKNTYIKLAATAMMSFLPTLMHGQSWLDETSSEKLQAIAERQEMEKKYNESVAEKESLQDTVNLYARRETDLSDKLKEQQEQLSGLYSDIKGREKGMYTQYDIVILTLHQGLCDPNIERIQQALLVCHNAEKVLSERYDKGNVDKARRQLSTVKGYVPELYKDIECRLAKYGEMTNQLRNTLRVANSDRSIRPEPDPERAPNATKKYQKRFFEKLEKEIYQELKEPDAFPFLYEIMTEAMGAIMDDPSNDLQKTINKL